MSHPVLDEIAAWDRSRPRSQQVEIGASGLYGCRAAAVLRLNGVEETDGRLRWDALVGTSIHAVAESAAPEGVLVEARFPYRGVTATVDRYDGRETSPLAFTLTDLKTKDDEAAVDKVRRDGPSRSQVAQVMLGAAALQEAGHRVDRVELLFLPRVGDPERFYLWESAPDREVADEAAQWAADVALVAGSRVLWPTEEQVDGLRDEPASFCRTYCPFVTACRGPALEVEVDDPLLVETAQEYLTADAEEKAAKARKDAARRFLEGFDQLPGLRWQGGSIKTVDEVDLDRVLQDYRSVFGEPPTRTVEKRTPRQLRRAS